jgi:hypothetical protein
LRYFEFHWNENNVGPSGTWGSSEWFVETDDEKNIVRQITVFDNGYVLKYDSDHNADEFGSLGDQRVQIEHGVVEMSADEFESKWNSTAARNS